MFFPPRCLDDTSKEAGRILRRHSMIVQKQRKAMRRRRSSVAVPSKLNKAQLAAIFGKRANPDLAVRRRWKPFVRPKFIAFYPFQVKGETTTEADSDSLGDSENGRRNSGEMISMKDFLQANKVSCKYRLKDSFDSFRFIKGKKRQGNTPEENSLSNRFIPIE